MKIATWNINSLRVRLPHILKWLEAENPDVLALQEIKMESEKFPGEIFKTAGYYTAVSGQKTYNGVALISRFPLVSIEMPDQDAQRRLLSATVNFSDTFNIRIINAYVPNGESLISSKYQYKLNWFLDFKSYISAQLKQFPRLIVLGDFNIAPADEDVCHPQSWEGKVLCSDLERQALQSVMQIGLADSFRLFPQLPNSFSWWDYRSMAFRRNAGLRIDHILVSNVLKPLCLSCRIDKTPRTWEQPSDHTPVIADFSAC